MVKLTIVKGKRKEKPSEEFYAKKYKEIAERTLEEIGKFSIKYNWNNLSKLNGLVGKLYLSRVRYCYYAYNVMDKKKKIASKKEMDELLFAFEEALVSLKTLSPKDLIILFPVSKNYDGEKYECLDYFSTMESFRGLPMDKPLISPDDIENMSEEELKEKDDKISLLIMEYQNKDIRKFNICHLLLTNMRMRIETGRDITDTLMGKYPELGRSKYTYFVDSNGKRVWINAFGKTMKEKIKIPKGWKVVK